MLSSLTAKIVGYVLAGAAVALLAWWGYSHIYDNGYSAATVVYEAKIASMKADASDARNAEVERQDAANNAAKTQEARDVADLQSVNADLQSRITELEREADNDPDAARPVLGTGSVQRINSVR